LCRWARSTPAPHPSLFRQVIDQTSPFVRAWAEPWCHMGSHSWYSHGEISCQYSGKSEYMLISPPRVPFTFRRLWYLKLTIWKLGTLSDRQTLLSGLEAERRGQDN
jgi:hypothetical protein